MANTEKINLRELAERIYNLDERVYLIIGSSLGRVYNGEKEHNIQYIIDLLESKNGAPILRDELALIGNMAKTIPDLDNQIGLQAEYAAILKQTKAQADHYTRIDILDEKEAALNALPLASRFSEQDKKIICISRTYGSGGDEIGFALATELGLNYYDKTIFAEIQKRFEAGKKNIWKVDHFYEKNPDIETVYTGAPFTDEPGAFMRQYIKDFKKYHGLPKRDAMYFTQSRMISVLAQRENFVIMGRYADILLTNENIPHVSIFISAPFEKRLERMLELYPEYSEKQMRRFLEKVDSDHKKDYRYFTGQEMGDTSHYDITINSASYGVAGSVELILRMLESEINYR